MRDKPFWAWLSFSVGIVAFVFWQYLNGDGWLFLGSVLILTGYFYALKTGKRSRPYTKTLLVASLFSLICTVAFALNLAISAADYWDGISVSNAFVFMFFGEDGWSIPRFKHAFDVSINVSIALVVLFAVALAKEKLQAD